MFVSHSVKAEVSSVLFSDSFTRLVTSSVVGCSVATSGVSIVCSVTVVPPKILARSLSDSSGIIVLNTNHPTTRSIRKAATMANAFFFVEPWATGCTIVA